ncbi:MFS transporter (plasmid) [Priestia endophytica]|uniref:MFS transporter n=1 Tax=Priestia endophytica TaxID=135735 RepID=UPI000DCA926C|nr:MFS transporter [Priestia endophytica]RAS91023.1 MFS transporter [Priestia endophytica]
MITEIGDGNSSKQPMWLQGYIDSPEKQTQLYKKTLIVVILAQMFGGAGITAGITVGALLVQDMLGTESVAGLQAAVSTIGSAGTALIIGRLSQRFGRRAGIAFGFFAGGIGAISVVIATLINSLLLFFVSLFIYGAGTTTNLLARYAGTDLATDKQRGTAVSLAMVSTTIGAVVSPNLVDIMGGFAHSIGVPILVGPFILAAVSLTLSGLIVLIFLRPEPLIVSTAIANAKEKNGTLHTKLNVERTTINKKGMVIGTTIMVLTQFVMIAIMTMTPVNMKHHNYGLKEIGLVMGFHIGAMYFPSIFTGPLVDKFGRTVIAIASGVTLIASGILAAFTPPNSTLFLICMLILLGVGWNLDLISGTTLLVDATPPAIRAKTQGSVEVLYALKRCNHNFHLLYINYRDMVTL